MVRNIIFFVLVGAMSVSCGGGSKASPENAGNEDVTSENGGASKNDVTDDEQEAEVKEPEASTPNEAASNDSANAVDEAKSDSNQSNEESEEPPSDDLQSYVGTGAYTPEFRTILDNMNTFKQCYLDAMREDPDIQGTIKVKFTVTKVGAVTKASAVVNELNSRVEQCVLGHLRKIKFPKRSDNRTVEYPFKFIPGPKQ